jgi:4-diphosphocytidyl-2-C-methyl-D-erythritol kinase
MVFLHKLIFMIYFPGAKINIGLRITDKRQDGYHDIETIFYPVGLCDALEFVAAESSTYKDNLRVTGIETGGDPGSNLVIKTILRLRVGRQIPYLNIHLHKAIPVGAGLGGGSSDAACMLKVLNSHFKLDLENNILKTMALELGSDCPFFIDCIPVLATGRGEIMTPVKPVLSGFYLVLVNPGVGVNTAEAYKNCLPAKPSCDLGNLAAHPVEEWREFVVNDFEDFAFKKHPVIRELKEELYRSGAIFSLMSGSGSSVYGIFNTKPRLSHRLKEFVIWEGVL